MAVKLARVAKGFSPWSDLKRLPVISADGKKLHHQLCGINVNC
jgi:hypothetical protein